MPVIGPQRRGNPDLGPLHRQRAGAGGFEKSAALESGVVELRAPAAEAVVRGWDPGAAGL